MIFSQHHFPVGTRTSFQNPPIAAPSIAYAHSKIAFISAVMLVDSRSHAYFHCVKNHVVNSSHCLDQISFMLYPFDFYVFIVWCLHAFFNSYFWWPCRFFSSSSHSLYSSNVSAPFCELQVLCAMRQLLGLFCPPRLTGCRCSML